MKNKRIYFFFTFVIFIFLNFNLFSEELNINASKIKYKDQNKITIFESTVTAEDSVGNKLFSEYADYNDLTDILKTKGYTKIITSGGFKIIGSDIFLDNKQKTIYSSNKTQVTDQDGNKIFLDMFNYSIATNVFFSKGNIKVIDVNNNNYNFSEVYIDENKKKIIGTDVKAFLKQDDISINSANEPRLFANTMVLSNNVNTLEKGIFTYCKNRENEKCPPWVLQSKKIKHNLAEKIIYYENVVLKIYDFPIFFSPRFSHPDPSIDRASGFLAPGLTSNTNVGSGFSTPYFWNISKDRDLTLTPRIYLNENPLLLAEYRQDFKNSFLIVDTGYTQGYKKKSTKKSSGGRAHFFANLNVKLLDNKEKYSSLETSIQKVSNDTYFKIYDVDSSLVDKSQNILENTIDFIYQNKDFSFSLTPSFYENITKDGHSRNEYLLPATFEKSIFNSEKYGLVDFTSNLKVKNYQVDKQTNFLVNSFNWKSNKWINKLGFENHFKGLLKNVNYESTNTEVFKDNQNNVEAKPALGYFAKLGLYKNDIANNTINVLTPKFLLRYAPNNMRKVKTGSKLDYGNLFSLNKINEFDIVEDGLSTSLGFEYKKNKLNKDNTIGNELFSLSAGQVISAKENINIPSKTSLDQHFSDFVGEAIYNVKEGVKFGYKFNVDQNYQDFNYNEVDADFKYESVKFNVGYLQEKNHVGSTEYIKSGFDFRLNNSTELSFSAKRNLLTSSAEFYNLSYNYINDCLKAGIAYRREFYNDRDVEPVNSLMFTISIVPFAQINSPSFKR
jgi:LPS-assembly protein